MSDSATPMNCSTPGLPVLHHLSELALPLWLLQSGRPGFDPWVGKIPWRRKRLPTPVLWPGEFHGLYSPWGLRVGHNWATFAFSLLYGLELFKLLDHVTMTWYFYIHLVICAFRTHSLRSFNRSREGFLKQEKALQTVVGKIDSFIHSNGGNIAYVSWECKLNWDAISHLLESDNTKYWSGQFSYTVGRSIRAEPFGVMFCPYLVKIYISHTRESHS